MTNGEPMQNREFEASSFGALNRIVEPFARGGVPLPLPCPHHLIVVEVRGRKTGLTRSVPLLAAVLGDIAVVSTVRSRGSQWFRNVAADPRVRCWMMGRPFDADAVTIAPRDGIGRIDTLPLLTRPFAAMLASISAATGVSFAILLRTNRTAELASAA
jgi:deazaflavin-dependent oxidoreductase (nitroreductase family)